VKRIGAVGQGRTAGRIPVPGQVWERMKDKNLEPAAAGTFSAESVSNLQV